MDYVVGFEFRVSRFGLFMENSEPTWNMKPGT